MAEGEPVFPAIVLVTIGAPVREIDAFPACRAGGIDRGLVFPGKKPGEKLTDPPDDLHRHMIHRCRRKIKCSCPDRLKKAGRPVTL
jgi:hypothetical protein